MNITIAIFCIIGTITVVVLIVKLFSFFFDFTSNLIKNVYCLKKDMEALKAWKNCVYRDIAFLKEEMKQIKGDPR